MTEHHHYIHSALAEQFQVRNLHKTHESTMNWSFFILLAVTVINHYINKSLSVPFSDPPNSRGKGGKAP